MSAAEDLSPRYVAAMQFAHRGLRLLPVEHHTRTAILPKWEQNAANDMVFVDRHFASGYNNIGLCCGPQPAKWNILCVDVDDPAAWEALEAEHGPVDRDTLCWHRTPSGGKHLFFDVPPGLAITRQKWPVPGIDLRGGHEGNVGCGYVLLSSSEAPSKVTGELLPYGFSPGKGLLDRDPGPAPDWLLQMIVDHLHPPEQASRERHPSAQPLADDNPWDWVRRNAFWPDYLVKHGWQQKGDKWSRPGKSPREGTGAYLHDDGRFTFWTQTGLPSGMVELGHLNVDGSYSISLADFIAAYEFGGDRQAFGREFRLNVMPPPPGAGLDPTATSEDESSEVDDGGSWSTPVDLVGYLDGTAVLDPPSILLRTDGVGLFYPGTINGIHGESGLGKGWVAVTAAAEVIRAGGVAVYVDLEDTPTSITTRLRNVGLTVDEIKARLVYLRPQDPSSPKEIARLVELCRVRHAALVVIDSLGEAFGLDSINEDKDNEVAPWLRQIPRAIADTGACVLIVDHVTKAVENPLYPKGSARKRAAVGGASYLIEALKPLTKGGGGKLRLTCAKDRYGFHSRGAVAAEMVFNPSGPDDMIVRIFPVGPSEDVRSPQERQDEQVAECAVEMIKVVKRRRAGFTKTSIVEATAGWRAEIKRASFDLLVENGRLVALDRGKFKISDSGRSPL